MPRILVVAPNWIGDALMAQPLLARLHEKTPGLKLDVLAPEWVAPVVRRMPEVEDVIAVPFRHRALQLGERWKIARELKARGYDQAIVLPNTWKSALVPFFAGIPLRSGYVGEVALRPAQLGLPTTTKRRCRCTMPGSSEAAGQRDVKRTAAGAAAARRAAGDRSRETALRHRRAATPCSARARNTGRPSAGLTSAN